jgi:hypothetical protein
MKNNERLFFSQVELIYQITMWEWIRWNLTRLYWHGWSKVFCVIPRITGWIEATASRSYRKRYGTKISPFHLPIIQGKRWRYIYLHEGMKGEKNNETHQSCSGITYCG